MYCDMITKWCPFGLSILLQQNLLMVIIMPGHTLGMLQLRAECYLKNK